MPMLPALPRRAALAALLALAGCGPQPLPATAVEGEAGWPQWPADQSHGQVTAVDVDSHNHVFVLHRAGRAWPVGDYPTDPIEQDTIFVFDGDSGALLARWGAGIFTMPHGLSIAPDDSVWVTDAGREQLLHFTHDGELLAAIGENGVTGDDETHFGRPTDIAFEGGDLLVSDGYRNARVARFGADGDFVSQFGEAGQQTGQFRLPHSIEVKGDRIYVADRENGRVQMFGPNGEARASWSHEGAGLPYAAKPMPGRGLLVAEGRDRAGKGTVILRLYQGDGQLLGSFDLASGSAGPHRAHDLAIGPDGAIYVADVMGDALVKLLPGALETD